MDLEPQRFATWEDLRQYIWKVACAVGLVSIRLFGCTDPAAERYAVALGHALQLTNILRDVGEDLANGGRIYLPLADLARFRLRRERPRGTLRDARFLALMDFEADRAGGFFPRGGGTAAGGRSRRAAHPPASWRRSIRNCSDKMRARRVPGV